MKDRSIQSKGNRMMFNVLFKTILFCYKVAKIKIEKYKTLHYNIYIFKCNYFYIKTTRAFINVFSMSSIFRCPAFETREQLTAQFYSFFGKNCTGPVTLLKDAMD